MLHHAQLVQLQQLAWSVLWTNLTAARRMCGQRGTCSTLCTCDNASCVLHTQTVTLLCLLGAGRADVWSARHRQDHAGQGCCHRVQNHLLQCLLINPGLQVQVSPASCSPSLPPLYPALLPPCPVPPPPFPVLPPPCPLPPPPCLVLQACSVCICNIQNKVGQ